MNISLTKVAQLAGGECINCEEKDVTCITTDTRSISEGCVFVALKGEKFDGHDFALEAVQNGAVAVLSHKSSREFSKEIPLIKVDDTLKALAKLAGGYRDMLSPVVIGVTGSVGKTSTKDMIASVMSQAMPTHKTQGNLNNHIGVPRTLLALNENDRAAVVEMGMNHSGEISYLTQIAKPDVAVITNIGISHLEYLKTRENILKAKLEILESMAPSAPLIVNADNDLLSELSFADGRRIVRCSVQNENADICAKSILQGTEGIRFEIYSKGEFFTDVYLPAVGVHNVENALLAAAVGIEAGLSPQQIAAGLAAYVPSGMRQKVTKQYGMTFIEDCYNASPTSMKASLAVLRSIAPKRAVAVLGDMLELGDITKSAHHEIGALAKKYCDLLVCCGKSARLMCEAAEQKGLCAKYFETRQQAAEFLVFELKADDCVLFKASFSMKFDEIISAVYSGLEEKEKESK